jgi:hypothetical protein
MTQAQREALIDLILLSQFSDSHVSIKEGVSLDTAIESLGWDSPKPRDIYFLTATSRARKATDSAESTAAFIKERAAAFADPAEQDQALAIIRQVMESDGATGDEVKFLAQIAGAFA